MKTPLVCAKCGKNFQRYVPKNTTRIITLTYCGNACARAAAGERFRRNDATYADARRFRHSRESMV
jgi:hypothetical protein